MKGGSFAAGFKKARRRFEKRLPVLQRAVSIKLFSAIVMDTPVLTGRLRANWNTSLDAPDKSTGEGGDPSGVGTIAEIVATCEAGNADNVMIFTNNLPYAYRIEYEGWSSVKAPQGMVNRNVLRFKRILKDQLQYTKSRT
jgi:hypothetical protein